MCGAQILSIMYSMSSFSASKITSLLSSDAIFLAVLFVILFITATVLGKSKLVSLVIAFYPAIFLYKNIPFFDKLLFLKGDSMLILNKVIIFLILLALLYIIVGRYIFSPTEYSGGAMMGNMGVVFALLILFLVFAYTVVSFDSFHNFGPSIDALFATPAKVFGWLMAPLILLAFL